MDVIMIMLRYDGGNVKRDLVSAISPSTVAKALKRYAFIRSIPFNYDNVDLVVTKDGVPFLIEPEQAYAYKRKKPLDRWKSFKAKYDATRPLGIAA